MAAGDVNGDGMPDIVTAPGPGTAPIVRVFDGASHALIREFMGAEPSFTGGLVVAVAAVDGDGFADIIVGLDAGGEPLVRVFSGWSGAVIRRFLAYASGFRGGVHVAAGDMNGDGYADIICGAGPGGGPHVVAFNAVNLSTLASFYAYAPTFAGGVWVAAGDVDGDGRADIVTGPGPGGGTLVRVFSGATGTHLTEFSGLYRYDPSFTAGLRVAVADVGSECDGCWGTRDGRADIITAPGPGGGSLVQIWNVGQYLYTPGAAASLTAFDAYDPSFSGGVFVSAAGPLNRMSIDAPRADATVGTAFVVAGWALEEQTIPYSPNLVTIRDPNSDPNPVDAIHMWAFPVSGAPPTFLGAATPGDSRPDVAAIFGSRFANAGYHLYVAGTLAAGDYLVVVYVHNVVSQTFNNQRVVRISVR